MSGSGGDTGYDYQANAIAYVAAHALTEQPLGWFDDHADVIASWSAETAGPGDDVALSTTSGRTIEIQAKHALARGSEYLDTFRKLLEGLQSRPSLRAVLIVDRHASNVIRDELKTDINRLGQGRTDGLKAITQELLSDLEQAPLPSIFSRLKVVVVDLDEGSDGTSLILGLLSQIVPKESATTAYELLGKLGHKLIKTRGRDDVLHCARFLDSRIGLIPSDSLSAVSFARIQSTFGAANSYFYSPALQRQFESTSAWSVVNPLEDDTTSQRDTLGRASLERELKRYQEWSRLATSRGRTSQTEADLLLRSQPHLAIIGGPGSGKTTLSKKITYLVSKEHVALRVRLPMVATLMREGRSFEAAMAEAVADSVGIKSSVARSVLVAAEYLVADGLDECDPSRAEIASSLERWSLARPDLRICVMTRPVGHSSSLLPSFLHAELVPLDEHEIRDVAAKLISSHIEDEAARVQSAKDFMDAIGKRSSNKTATIAARNPLLLSFLVRLHLDGEPLSGNRTQLFERIIELIRRSYPTERVALNRSLPDHGTAWHVAELLGWSTVEKPGRETSALYVEVGSQLGGGLSNARLAEIATNLWNDHGLIERVTVGSREGLVFVHLSLGEFLAGRYLSKLAPEVIALEVGRVRRKAKWREPLLFASGSGAHRTIVPTLISLDDPSDPESTEAVLAAACVGELDPSEHPGELAALVAEKLKERLSSPIPLVAIEAGEALLKIAPLVPELIAHISIALWRHPQPWTRTASICAGIATGSESMAIDRVTDWLATDQDRENEWDVQEGAFVIPAGYELRKAAIPVALKRVAEEILEIRAKEIVVRYLTRANVSVGITEEVRIALAASPAKEWVAEAYLHAMRGLTDKDLFSQMQEGQDQSRSGEIVFLDCVMGITREPAKASSDTSDRFLDLGTLVSSMGYWDMSMGDMISIDSDTAPELTEVIKGIVSGLKLDLGRLRFETSVMRAKLSSPRERMWEVPQNKQEPDWDTIRKQPATVTLLAKALDHRSQFVSRNAVRLLNGRTYTSDEKAALGVQFKVASRNLRFWGSLASQLWGDQAFNHLRQKLIVCKTSSCGDLYIPLLQSSNNESERELAVKMTVDAAGAANPAIAERAAKALRSVESLHLHQHADKLSELLTVWKERGSWCWRCQETVKGSSCSKCHIVPPGPRKHLVASLAKAEGLSLDRLFDLAKEHEFGVDEEARAAIIEQARKDTIAMERMMSAIDEGEVSLLGDILKGGDDLTEAFGDRLRALLCSKSSAVRSRLVGSLATGWMPSEEARRNASVALTDDAPNVRSAAARVLRDLGERDN